MPTNQRCTTILELLDKDGIVHTAELIKLMDVSSETIRRDPEYPDSPPVQGARGTLPLRISERLCAGRKSRYYHHCLTDDIDKRITERQSIMNIFDILGPVMIGPSSSHTAGAARIDRTTLALLRAPVVKANIFLHGSFTKTYKGHGMDKVLITSIMEVATDDSRTRRAPEPAKEQGLEVNIAISNIDGAHPNTARVTLVDAAGSTISLLESSIGSGNILVREVNSMEVPITGRHTTLIALHRDAPGTIAVATRITAGTGVNICNSCLSRQSRGGEAVITIEINGSFGPELNGKIKMLPDIFSSTMLQPVQLMKPAATKGFVLVEPEFNYSSATSIVTAAEKDDLPISAIALRQQAKQMEQTGKSMYKHIWKNYRVMTECIGPGYNKGLKSTSGLTGGSAFKIHQISKSKKSLTGSFLSGTLYRALTVSELSAAMGRVVVAPTAGGCSILPAALLTMQKEKRIPEKDCVMSPFTASAVGMVIANNASLADVQGGCQVECGSAAAMAAAAIVGLADGTPKMAEHAIATAIKDILRLVYDPVTGLTEIPYIKRSASGVAGAFVAAELALVGIESATPADEVIWTVKKVGDTISSILKEAVEGGLTAAPTGRHLREHVFGAAREAHSGCSGCGGCSS